MIGKAHGQIAGILASYDFSHFQTIADIGGGRGHLLKAVLGTALNATGVLFDQPHVVKDATGITSARLKLQGGDFFKDALPVCDCYMIMQVIHDWSDAQSVEILSAIRRTAPAHAKLLLIEAIIPEDLNPSWIKMLDIFLVRASDGQRAHAPRVRRFARDIRFWIRQGSRRRTGYVDPGGIDDLARLSYTGPSFGQVPSL